MIKKGVYDVDIFVRFDKRHKNISDLTKKILKDFKKTDISSALEAGT